jgi:surfeit locus 1 family protein
MMAGANKRQRPRALRVILALVAGVMFAGFLLWDWQSSGCNGNWR